MNYIHIKIKSTIISMISDRLSCNIFIDLNENQSEKITLIENAMSKKKTLTRASILKLQQNKTLIW